MYFQTFCVLLVLFCVVQQCHSKSIDFGDSCSLKDVLSIIKTNTELISQQVDSAGSNIQQHCTDAKETIQRLMDAETVAKVLLVMQNTLENLQNPDACTKQTQVHFNSLHNKIGLQYTECNLQSKYQQKFLENKMESTAKWTQSVKIMTGLVLQKCAMKNILAGCTSLKSCCLQAVSQMTYKIIETNKNNTDNIQSIVSKQTDCFDLVAKEALSMQKRVQGEVFVCNFRGAQAEESKDIGEMDSDESSETNFKNDVFEVSTENSVTSENVPKQISISETPLQTAEVQQDVKLADAAKSEPQAAENIGTQNGQN